MINPQTILAKVNLAPAEIKVFLAMTKGHVKVKNILAQTDMKRPSVYYALSGLEQKGLVGRVQVGEYNQWQLKDVSELKNLVSEKKRSVGLLEREVDKLVEELQDENTPTVKPKITYYESISSIKSVIKDTLYCKKKHIKSIAPKNNFFFQLKDDFAYNYVSERKERGISTQNLWQEPLPKKIMEEIYAQVSTVRVMPKTMQERFKTTVFIYDDKVLYVAPLKESYAVLFHSRAHHNMMESMFDTIWDISKKIK